MQHLVDLVAEEWSQQESYTVKISQHEVSRTDTNKHHTCNKNKSQSQHTSPHISTHLHTSPHISTHLHTSPHLGDGSKSVWDVSELEAELGRELSRKFEVFRSYVSHCRKHGDPETPLKGCCRSPKRKINVHSTTLHYIALHCTWTCSHLYILCQRDNLLDLAQQHPTASNCMRHHAALAPAML